MLDMMSIDEFDFMDGSLQTEPIYKLNGTQLSAKHKSNNNFDHVCPDIAAVLLQLATNDDKRMLPSSLVLLLILTIRTMT